MLEFDNSVVQTRTAKVFLDQTCVAHVIFGNQDDHLTRRIHGLFFTEPGAGKERKNVLPWPSTDSTQIFPPCRSTIRCAIVSPKPSPWPAPGFKRWKISKILC